MPLEGAPARHHVISCMPHPRRSSVQAAVRSRPTKRISSMTTSSLKERALQDPQSVFETPEAVLQSDQLAPGHKRTILERWQQLVGSPSSDASTPGREPGLATRLARALAFLDT